MTSNVPERAHEDLGLVEVGLPALEHPRHAQDGLDRAQAPVVVELPCNVNLSGAGEIEYV